MNTGHILAMYEQELHGYHPDLLTIYTGYNDATWPLDENAVERAQRWLDEHSAAYAGLRKLVHALGGSLHHRHAQYLPTVSREAAQRQVEMHIEVMRENLTKVLEQAKRDGVPVVFIRQPIQGGRVIPDGQPRPTYEGSYQAVAEEMAARGEIQGVDMPIYVHHALLETQAQLAREYSCQVVDNVAIVDAHPPSLETVVHLSEDANERLARALSDVIVPMLDGASLDKR